MPLSLCVCLKKLQDFLYLAQVRSGGTNENHKATKIKKFEEMLLQNFSHKIQFENHRQDCIVILGKIMSANSQQVSKIGKHFGDKFP